MKNINLKSIDDKYGAIYQNLVKLRNAAAHWYNVEQIEIKEIEKFIHLVIDLMKDLGKNIVYASEEHLNRTKNL